MGIFSFDFGTSSLGLATRGFINKYDFDYVASLIIDDEFADTKEASLRLRQKRVRESHYARESYLRSFFENNGLKSAILYPQTNALKCPSCKVVIQHAHVSGKKLKHCANSSCSEKGKKGKWAKLADADKRLTREFPAKGDETVYCGAILRAMLIKGESLEPWQIFKAFHSAIQKRGYDANVAWKANITEDTEESTESDDEAANKLRVSKVTELINQLPKGCQHPCFWEALQMGLWSVDQPETYNLRINHLANSTKEHSGTNDPHVAKGEKVIIPRKLPAVYSRASVESELRAMYHEAEKQMPALAGQCGAFLYGPGEIAYASYIQNRTTKFKTKSAEVRRNLSDKGVDQLIQGKASDWQGVLSQKIPNFDNRSPNSCTLFPSFKVARVQPRIFNGKIVEDSIVTNELSFLLQLKNLRFIDSLGEKHVLPYKLIGSIFENQKTLACKTFADLFGEKPDVDCIKGYLSNFRFTATQLKKQLKDRIAADWKLQGDKSEIDAGKSGGRSRFSRPACKLLRELILSGEDPVDFRKSLLASDHYAELRDHLNIKTGKRYEITEEDLSFFDPESMGGTWDNLYVPDQSLSKYNHLADSPTEARHMAIRELIGNQKNPVVRHRLGFFWEKLQELELGNPSKGILAHGIPDAVALEFVRDDFMGKANKKKLQDVQKRNRDMRKKYLTAEGGSEKNAKKRRLIEEQGGVCLYTGKNLEGVNLNELEIEHIVPRAKGGSDAMINLCITTADENTDKADATPYDWFQSKKTKDQWSAYLERVNKLIKNPKKRELLTSSKAYELSDRYQKLAETSWIAKLAKTVVCLNFGWKLNAVGGSQKVMVIPGALTSKTARRYGLYHLLDNAEAVAARHEAKRVMAQIEPGDRVAMNDAYKKLIQAEESIDKKHRADKRHHALDAMVLSFIPQWAADKKKRIFHRFPDAIIGKAADHRKKALLQLAQESGYKKLPNGERRRMVDFKISQYEKAKAQDFFRPVLEDVFPDRCLRENPSMLATIYSGSKENETLHLRRKLTELPSFSDSGKPQKPAKSILDKIQPDELREKVREFWSSNAKPSADQWLLFCEGLTLANGSKPKKYLSFVEGYDNAIDLSKDQCGAFRRSDKTMGYFVYLDHKQKFNKRNVRFFEHVSTIKKDLLNDDAVFDVVDFFSVGCPIEVTQTIKKKNDRISCGKYWLTMKNNGKSVTVVLLNLSNVRVTTSLSNFIGSYRIL